jgi:6-phosphogluconolactonase
VSNDGKWVLAVNPASNTISAFKITDAGLKLTSTVPSRGIRPISIACYNNIVYVLHSNEFGQIAGFKLTDGGILTPIENTVKTLGTTATVPSQISFKLDANGVEGDLFSIPANANYPFGFALGKEGNIYVSESANASLSVYRISLTGITNVAGPLPTNQANGCWLAATPNGKYIYIANANSNSVTGFNINTLSSFSLMQSNGLTAVTGIKPVDIAVSDDSMFAYVLNYEDKSIRTFYITQTGGLEKIEDRYVIPAGSTGIAVK